MQTADETYEKKLESAFQTVLNSHGYGFHYSVLKLASDLHNDNKSDWLLEAVEFPVQVQSSGLRIDFILRHRDHPTFYLLAECKRVNPALSNWCFARAPFIRRNRSIEWLFLEHFQRKVPISNRWDIYSSSRRGPQLKDAYHIALDVRSGERGDPFGKGRGGVIEEASTQVCRGIGGMVEFLARNLLVLGDATEAHFLPVIFTTAQIWTSDVNLSSAELQTGKVNLSDTDFSKRDYIFYQYQVSPGLKHSYSPVDRPANIGELMDSEYVRSIAIVGASGIQPFLNWSSQIDLW